MKLIVEATAKEIADLVLELQDRQPKATEAEILCLQARSQWLRKLKENCLGLKEEDVR